VMATLERTQPGKTHCRDGRNFRAVIEYPEWAAVGLLERVPVASFSAASFTAASAAREFWTSSCPAELGY